MSNCPFCPKKIPKSKLLSHLDEHMEKAYVKETEYYNLGQEILREWQKIKKGNKVAF